MLYKPKEFCVDRDDNIYILDGGRNQVVALDKNGFLLFTFGKGGQGPGEFFRPFDIEIGKGERLYLSDYGNRRINFYSLKGEYLETFRTREHCQLFSVNDFIYTSYPTRGYRIHAYSPKGDLAHDFGPVQEHKDPLIHSLLNMGHLAVDQLNTVYFCYIYSYEIEIYKLIKNGHYELTNKFKGKSSFGKNAWTAAEIDGAIKRDGNPPRGILSGITVDENSVIYVWQYLDQKERHGYTAVHSFDNLGEYQKRLELPFKASSIDVCKGKLYAIDFESGELHKYSILGDM